MDLKKEPTITKEEPLKDRTIPFVIGLVIFIFLGISAFIYHGKKTVATVRTNAYIVQYDLTCNFVRNSLINAFIKGDDDNSQNVQNILSLAKTQNCLVKIPNSALNGGVYYQKNNTTIYVKP